MGASEAGEVTADVAENAAGAVAPGSVDTSSSIPDEVTEKLDRIIDLLESTVAQSTPEHGSGVTDTSTDSGDVVEPRDGGMVRDDSPASLPWTHRRIGH